MTDISFFQKYSKNENHITNNTLLMLRHFYRTIPMEFANLLQAIIGEEEAGITIGPSFEQQTSGEESVFDGDIRQTPFNIFIETKTDGNLNEGQIQGHIGSIKKLKVPGATFLVGLTREEITDAQKKKILRWCKGGKITFASVTFLSLLDSIREFCPEYESGLREIINDYENLLQSGKVNLLVNPTTITVFPSTGSYKRVLDHKMYCHPASRNMGKKFKYIGIYNNKKVLCIAEVQGTCVYDPIKKHLSEARKISEKEAKKRVEGFVKDTIKDEDSSVNLNQEPFRYYLFREWHETEIQKASSGGMQQSHRYFDLNDLAEKAGKTINKNKDTIADIAEKVRGATYK